MRFGLPWRVEGIRHEARETAEAAARQAGLPLNEWLNAVILQQAGFKEVANLTGGMLRWRAEGHPVERGST